MWGCSVPKATHLEIYEEDSKRTLRVGVTDDCKRIYVGYTTRAGVGDVMQLKKEKAAEMGGKMMNWAQHYLIDDEEE